MTPRPPPKISDKDHWMCDLDSDIAGSSKDIQRVEPKPKTQLSSTERPVCAEKEERTKFDRDTLNQEKHDEVIDPTSSERPVWGPESTERCVLTPKHVENDQTGAARPVLVDQKRGARHCFQSTRTVTCSCERSRTSPSSRACEGDRKSSSSRVTSSRLAAE